MGLWLWLTHHSTSSKISLIYTCALLPGVSAFELLIGGSSFGKGEPFTFFPFLILKLTEVSTFLKKAPCCWILSDSCIEHSSGNPLLTSSCWDWILDSKSSTRGFDSLSQFYAAPLSIWLQSAISASFQLVQCYWKELNGLQCPH